jgi:ribosomal protein S18 acetylase RimI-like enzyme
MEPMRDAIQIRPARPADVEVAGALLYSAYTHTPVTLPLPESAGGGWVEHLKDYFGREGNRFSYQFTQVADGHAQVVGLVLSFGGREEARLNAAVGPWLEHEAEDDEWYVDALAVLQDWSRRGIGARLLAAAEQQARQHGYLRVTLHVAQGNEPALAFYAHEGYAITGQAVLYQHPFVRMSKVLASAADGDAPA